MTASLFLTKLQATKKAILKIFSTNRSAAQRALENETSEYWLRKSQAELANTAAALHRQRREAEEERYAREVELTRATFSDIFIKGTGLEVGAGSRPFPLPPGVKCFYGDKRDAQSLEKYFGDNKFIPDGTRIDAQSFQGIEEESLDFVISAHVIEHLEDPIGSIRNAIQCLKPGGIHLLVVPDRRHTFDRDRPGTPLSHVIQDAADGGKSTKAQAYEEHCRYIHTQWNPPIAEKELESTIQRLIEANFDTHFHCWTGDEFAQLLEYALSDRQAEVVGRRFIHNENIFAIKKAPPF